MHNSLRVLNLEDSEQDSALLKRHLLMAGYDLTWLRLDTAAKMRKALDTAQWDVILCDFAMPRFDALRALALLRDTGIDIPFIIISGTVGEETAVGAMLSGAHDYLTQDNLARLVPAIERELKEVKIRRELREVEAAKNSGEERYQTLFEHAPDGMLIADADGVFIDANPCACKMFGYEREEMIGLSNSDIIQGMTVEEGKEAVRQILAGAPPLIERKFLKKDGTVFDGERHANPMPDETVFVIIRDITERKKTEAELYNQRNELRTLFDYLPAIILVKDTKNGIVRANKQLATMAGFTVEELEGKQTEETFPEFAEKYYADDLEVMETRLPKLGIVEKFYDEEGGEIIIQTDKVPMFDVEGAVNGVIVMSTDITQRMRDVEKLRESEYLLAASQRITHLGSWVIGLDSAGEIKSHTERWSDEHYRIFGYEPGEFEITDENFYNAIHPDDRERIAATIRRAIDERSPFDIEHRIIRPDGSERVVHVVAELLLDDNTGMPVKLLGSIQDITDRKTVEIALRESDEKFQQLADNITDAFWIRSPDLKQIYYISPAFEKIWGRSVEQVKAEPTEWLKYIMPEDREFVGNAYKELTESGPTMDIEYRILWPDGEIRWIRTRGFQVRDDDGKVIRLAGIVTDITERKKVLQALTESEERYRDLVENAMDIIYTLDAEGNYTSVNKACESITGYKREESLSRSMFDSIVPEYRDFSKKRLASHLAGASSSPYELEITAKDGHRVTIEVNTRPIMENGVAVGVQGIARDITDRKLADARINRLVNSNAQAVFFWNTSGAITGGNDAFLALIRHTREDLAAGRISWVGLTPPEYAYLDEIALEQLASTGKCSAYEKEWIRGDGSRIDVLMGAAMLENDPDEGVCFVLDISERKRAEAALFASELRYHSLFENMLEGYAYCRTIFDGDELVDFVYIEVNGAVEKLTGLKDIVGRSISEVIPTFREEVPHAFEVYTRVALTGVPEKFEMHIASLGIWLAVTVYSSDRDHFVAVFDNITERRRAEQLLTESREQLLLATESVQLGVWDWDIVEDRLHIDRRTRELYGRRVLTPNGGHDAWLNSVHPDDRKRAVASIKSALKGAEEFHTEFRIIWPSGEVHHIEAFANVQRADDGSPLRMVGVNWDITKRKELEEQLRQSQKMEAIGVLAGGVAHDFNNLLTAINGYSDLTLRKMRSDDPLRQNIEQVKDAGIRAADLTSQLLAFSRKQVLKPIVHNVNAVITNIEKMLRRIIHESVELRTALDPELGNVIADPGQIEQVIMNLAINGRDAMPNGGTLTIETGNVHLDDDYVSQHITVKSGDFIKITVSDTGDGMGEMIQSHIFEPFFTTKEVGKGTGLGLSTVYGIVKQSGGDIVVNSDIGYGTTFTIYLPGVDQSVEKPRWAGEREQRYQGTETILLVEDEELVRDLVREILTSNGYKVLEAATGQEGLALCKTYPDAIHLLLSDVILPKMGGSELKGHVVNLRPDIKVLFMSGYTNDSLARGGTQLEDISFIEKPFTPDALVRKIRDVLEFS